MLTYHLIRKYHFKVANDKKKLFLLLNSNQILPILKENPFEFFGQHKENGQCGKGQLISKFLFEIN